MMLALALSLLLAGPEPAGEGVAVGSPAPAFTLRTLNPEACGLPWVSLSRLVGPEAEAAGARVVLLSFFASWCEPCKRELPLLVELDRRYREAGLRVISVDVDADEPGIGAARALAAEAGLVHPVGSDRFGIVARRYLGERAPLPSVFLLRADGTVARIERGYAQEAPAFLTAAVRAELGLPEEAPRAAPPSARGKAQGRAASPLR